MALNNEEKIKRDVAILAMFVLAGWIAIVISIVSTQRRLDLIEQSIKQTP